MRKQIYSPHCCAHYFRLFGFATQHLKLYSKPT